jgi:hypothetical protein
MRFGGTLPFTIGVDRKNWTVPTFVVEQGLTVLTRPEFIKEPSPEATGI